MPRPYLALPGNVRGTRRASRALIYEIPEGRATGLGVRVIQLVTPPPAKSIHQRRAGPAPINVHRRRAGFDAVYSVTLLDGAQGDGVFLEKYRQSGFDSSNPQK